MMRRVITAAARRVPSVVAVRRALPQAVLRPVVPVVCAHRVNVAVPQARCYSGEAHSLTYEEVKERVLTVVKSFDKVDASKVTAAAHFQKDLGIDSLDTVELVMALEDEFVLEIPDVEAEKIQSVADAIQYISTHPHAK